MQKNSVEQILRSIKTNNIDEVIQITKELKRPPEKDINYLLSFSNFNEINTIIKEWGENNASQNIENTKENHKPKKIKACEKISKETVSDAEINLNPSKEYMEKKNYDDVEMLKTKSIKKKINNDESDSTSSLSTSIKRKSKVEEPIKFTPKFIKRKRISEDSIPHMNITKNGEKKLQSDQTDKNQTNSNNYRSENNKSNSAAKKNDRSKEQTSREGNQNSMTNEKLEFSTKENICDIVGSSVNNVEDPQIVIKKYFVGDPSRDKIISLFFDVFIKNISSCNYEQAGFISLSLVNEIIKIKKFNDKKFIATKKLNLNNPKNLILCKRVYEGEISPESFIRMSADEMKSEELKKKDEKIMKESICDVQVARPIADSNMFKCGKCKQSKTTFMQLQTRSGDEPMTTFVTCCTCGNRWKF